MIAIVDYGMGNIHSVKKALEFLGAKARVAVSPQDIAKAQKIVLPGVGAFDDAMLELKKKGLVPVLRKVIKGGKPFLGICLGMQILFDHSHEAKKTKGLGIIKGSVKKFPALKNLKVPHMGWNQLNLGSRFKVQGSRECLLLKGVPDNSYVYFCHSYYPVPQDKGVVAAVTEYGVNFSSIVWQENVYGVQFHPEKSQSIGMQILRNFVAL